MLKFFKKKKIYERINLYMSKNMLIYKGIWSEKNGHVFYRLDNEGNWVEEKILKIKREDLVFYNN